MSERHYRVLRCLWLAVFYGMIAAQLALVGLGWERHALAIMWLGVAILVAVGSTWPLLFQPSLLKRRTRPPTSALPGRRRA